MPTEHKLEIPYVIYQWQELSNEEQSLGEKALAAMNDAYSPYSNFTVGAAVLLEGGAIITGNNQENAAYPSGLCAERVALFSAKSQHPKSNIQKLFIVGKARNSKEFAEANSCGNCRQVIMEYESIQPHPIELFILMRSNEVMKISSASNYLPFSFTKKTLNS